MSERKEIRSIDERLEWLEFELAATRYDIRKVIFLLTQRRNITHFTITQQGDPMALLPIAPGFSPVFTATPVPSSSVPNPATPPTWTSSDPVNAPVSVDSTGLIVTVNVPASAVVGTSVTLSVSYTNADGTVATGSISITIVAVPSPDITSFTIQQTT